MQEHLQASLRGLAEPMLQPKKSTAEESLHTQPKNALTAKQVEYDQMLASAQAVAEEK